MLFSRNIFSRSTALLLILFWSLSSLFGPIFADQVVDITDTGRDLYTKSYQWEVTSGAGYNADAFLGFTDKLNAAIKTHKNLSALSGACQNCDVLNRDLDRKIAAFIVEHPESLQETADVIALISPYLDKRSGAIMTASLWSDLNALVSDMMQSIARQVRLQMDAYRDVSGAGLYTDGDLNNSPYDLLDDIRRIDEIFFHESPKYGTYTNSTREDVSGLITGTNTRGVWTSGSDYTLDLTREIEKALTGSDTSSDAGSSKNTLGTSCESGYCVTVDFINTSKYGEKVGQYADNSLQNIFEGGLDWITRNGDKRNLACKTAPTINKFESSNTRSLSFSKIFTGSTPYIFWKVPPFLRGFYNRDEQKASPDTSGQNPTTEKDRITRRVDDAIRAAYRRRGMDFSRPTDLLNTQKQLYEKYALDVRGNDLPIINATLALDKAHDAYQQSLVERGSQLDGARVSSINTDAIRPMEKTFNELSSRARVLQEYNADLRKVLDFIANKPYCTN